MEQRRWLLFFILSFAVLQFYLLTLPKPQPTTAPTSSGVAVTTDSITRTTMAGDAVPGTTGTARMANAPEIVDPRDAGAAARGAAEAALAGAGSYDRNLTHGAPENLTTATTEMFRVALDAVGGLVHSWSLLDTGSDNFDKQVGAIGVEMVRRIPAVDLIDRFFAVAQQAGGSALDQAVAQINRAISPDQTWPLEIKFKEANSRSYEEFNRLTWTRKGPTTDAQGDVTVGFVSPEVRGLVVEKTYRFPAKSRVASLRVTLQNKTTATISIYDEENRGMTLRWGPGLAERPWWEKSTGEEIFDIAAYRSNGAVVAMHPKAGNPPVQFEGPLEWAALESKFFAAVIIPQQSADAAARQSYLTRAWIPANHDIKRAYYHAPISLEVSSDRFDLAPQGSRAFDYSLYVGPKKYRVLQEASSTARLESIAFHESWTFMRVIYLGMTDLLNWIHRFVVNYGVAIILLTVLIRLVTFPLTHWSIKAQSKSMYEMQKIKPHIDAINEKYKKDPQEKSKRIMELYREHEISPLAPLKGCLPMLLQLPIFYGLYRVSSETIDLQGAHFLWIKDLSRPDHLLNFGFSIPLLGSYFNILPITMGLTQVISTHIAMARTRNSMDPTQRQLMYFMPLILIFVLYSMPSGLMIYWNASNVWQIFQTLITNRQLNLEEARRTARDASSGKTAADAAREKAALADKKPVKQNKTGKKP